MHAKSGRPVSDNGPVYADTRAETSEDAAKTTVDSAAEMDSTLDCAPLRDAAEREIALGLNACQVAVAWDQRIVWTGSFGAASEETPFAVASATKPIVAAAVWQLMGDGELDISRPVADYAPEFGENGKQAVELADQMRPLHGT